MKTAEEIQEEYATVRGYECFYDLIIADTNSLDYHVENVQKQYASQIAEMALECASERINPEHFYLLREYELSKRVILETPIQLP